MKILSHHSLSCGVGNLACLHEAFRQKQVTIFLLAKASIPYASIKDYKSDDIFIPIQWKLY